MPTYEYKCDACGYAFERFHSITAAPIKKCPECGKNKVKRLLGTGAGLIFKGSGFYITDYRDKSYTDKAKSESGGGGESKTETKSDAKGESKPAAAAEGGGASKAESKPAAASTPAAKPAASKPAGKGKSKS